MFVARTAAVVGGMMSVVGMVVMRAQRRSTATYSGMSGMVIRRMTGGAVRTFWTLGTVHMAVR